MLRKLLGAAPACRLFDPAAGCSGTGVLPGCSQFLIYTLFLQVQDGNLLSSPAADRVEPMNAAAAVAEGDHAVGLGAAQRLDR